MSRNVFDFFGAGRGQPDPSVYDIYPFAMHVYEEVRHFLHTNATAVNCYQILERFVVRALNVKGANSNFTKYVTDFYVPFFRNVLENIIIMGWCPFTYSKAKFSNAETGKEESVLVPVVAHLKHCKFELHGNRENHKFEMKCFTGDGFKLRRNVHYIFFHHPSRLANRYVMHSPLIGMLNEFRYVDQLRKFFIQAEHAAAHPMIFLGPANSNSSETGDAAMADAYPSLLGGARDPSRQGTMPLLSEYVQGDRNHGHERRIAANMEQASQQMVANLSFHREQMQRFNEHDYNNYYNLGLNYNSQRPLFVSPPGMTICQKPDVPITRANHAELERSLASKVMLSMGIPEALFSPESHVNVSNTSSHAIGSRVSGTGGSGISKKAGNQNIMHVIVFEATVDRYREKFTSCFCEIYRHIFQKEMPETKVNFKVPELYDKYSESMKLDFEERMEEKIFKEAMHIEQLNQAQILTSSQGQTLKQTKSTAPHTSRTNDMQYEMSKESLARAKIDTEFSHLDLQARKKEMQREKDNGSGSNDKKTNSIKETATEPLDSTNKRKQGDNNKTGIPSPAKKQKRGTDSKKKPEDSKKKPEDSKKKPEDSKKKPEDSKKKTEDSKKKTEDDKKKTEDDKKKTEDSKKKTEDDKKKTEDEDDKKKKKKKKKN